MSTECSAEARRSHPIHGVLLFGLGLGLAGSFGIGPRIGFSVAGLAAGLGLLATA